MKSKKVKLILGLLFPILVSTKVFAQTPKPDIINCDSLFSAGQSMTDCWFGKHPSLVKSFANVQNGFSEIVDSNLFLSSIYVKVYVDTSGYVHCSQVVKGNNNITDDIALKYVSSLKFTSAEKGGKKIPMFITVPLYCSKVNETKTLIRMNGEWFDKEDK